MSSEQEKLERLKRAARRARRAAEPAAPPEPSRAAAPIEDDEPAADEAPAFDVAEEVEEDARPRMPVPMLSKAMLVEEVVRPPEEIAADEFELDGDGEFVPSVVLTRMHLFVGHYLTDLNAAAAARKAGYSPKHADRQGRRLLAHPVVLRMLREQQQSILAKIGVTQERVWSEIAAIAFADVGDLFDEEGNFRTMSQVPERLRRAISSVKIVHKTFGDDGESVEREVRLVNKDGALGKLMALTGLTKEEKTTADDLANALLSSLAKARERVVAAANADR